MKTNYPLASLPVGIQQRARACGATYDVGEFGSVIDHSENSFEYVIVNAGALNTGQLPNEVIYWPDGSALGGIAWAVMTSKGWIVIADLQMTSSRRQDAGDLADFDEAVNWSCRPIHEWANRHDAGAILLMAQEVKRLKLVRAEEHEALQPYTTHIITRIQLTAVWLWRKNVSKKKEA